MADAVKTREVVDYYDQTEYDYRIAWYKRDNPAMHFGFYQKGEADTHFPALSHTNQVLATNARVADGQRILDAGCGLGDSAFWLARHFKVDVVGVSISSRQIDQCNRKAAIEALKGSTTFVTADFTNTPFAEGSFDVIWACESICHAAEKSDFYREASRLLKPGGRIVVAEYLRRSRTLSESEEFLLRQKWLKNWAIADIDTADEHQQNLEQAGFGAVEIKNVSDAVRVSLRNLHEKCTRSYPIGLLLKWLGIRSRVQHGNVVGSIQQYVAFKQALWWYGLITAEKGGPPIDRAQEECTA
ncbi:MAG: class I SAM-dependent methyltransferase [Saprospiraceae bacterium]|nr:class I SAM-dependent methyltransferase [Saprospiraceae bacterium]